MPSSRGGMRTSTVVRTVVVVIVTVVVFEGLVVAGSQDHSHDYEYSTHLNDVHSKISNSPQGLSSLKPRYEAKYFKCRCEGNQMWNGSSCIDKQTFVAVMHPDPLRIERTLTDSFAGVTVGEVQCSGDQARVYLNPHRNPTQQFTLLQNGSLSWQRQEYEHYCIEHILDAHGNLSWDAYVCLPPPEVPRCCLESLTPAPEGSPSCSDNTTLPFLPSISIGEEFVLWPKVVGKIGIKCKDNEKLLNITLNNGKSHLLFESGEMYIVWTAANNLTQKQKEGFCVRSKEGRGYVATVCYEDHEATHRALCGNTTCVRKCCPEGKINFQAYCIDAENETLLWKPSFTDANLSTDVSPPKDLRILYGQPQCNMYITDPAEESDKFYLLKNGTLYTPAIPEIDPPTHYCVDNFLGANETVFTKALICFHEALPEPVCAITNSKLYPAMLLVSCVFLGATLVIYLSVPDLRDKLHGRCLISLTSAFFVAYVLLSVTSLSNNIPRPSICTAIGFFKLLSLLAAFFWLNVMCFDIWRTLRKTRTIDAGRRGLHRFLWYSLYSWGSALLIALAAVVMDQMPSSYKFNIIRPGFSDFCWLAGKKSMWVYFYIWVSLVVVVNIVFFVLVVRILVKGQNNSLLRRSRDMNRERMWLYVKLFLVMGITWIAEMVSFKSYQSGNCSPWIFTDIINALQGFILFLVFILNRTTLRKIQARWKCCGKPRYVLSPSTTLTSSMSSSYSKRQDSILSDNFNRSPTSARYSITSSTTGNPNAECIIPLKTLQEAPEGPTGSP